MRVTFSTYPSILDAFREKTEIYAVSMSYQLEELTRQYLSNKIGDLTDLRKCLKVQKGQIQGEETKSQKLSFTINEELYSELKRKLNESGTRPATFYSYVIAYYLSQGTQEEDYRKKAEVIKSNTEIPHVVYGLKYYKPEEDHLVLCHKEFFIDACDDRRFVDYYQKPHSPFIEVLALHK